MSGTRSAPILAFLGRERAFPESGTSFPERLYMKSKRQRGFSLLEMMITVAIGLTIAGITFISMMPMFNRNHIDLAYDTTLAVLRDTRHLAISQGHEYIVVFDGNRGTMTVEYQPPADPVTFVYPGVQLVNTYSLPKDTSFAIHSNSPTGAANAPDGLGSGATSIDFGYTPVGGTGGSSTIVFMPDGSARDGTSPGNGGNYSSGVVYLTRPSGVITDSRAITVWGATGRIRGWRLSVISGTNTWIQQ